MRRLKALEAYLEVAELGSVTAAARSLKLSQPAVSRLIQDLERDLRQELFERVGKRLVPTARGLSLRDDAERALMGFQELWERAREVGEDVATPVRVSAVSSIAFGLLPEAWHEFGAEGRLRLDVKTETPDRVQNAVVAGDAHMAATSAPIIHRDLRVEWLGHAPCVLAVRDDDPLAAGTGPISLSALRGRSLVGMSARRGAPARMRQALRRAGIEPSTAVRTNSTVNALSFVRAGAGVAVIEPVSIAGAEAPGLRILPLTTSIPYCFGVVTHGGAPMPEGASDLIGALERAATRRLANFSIIRPEERPAFLAALARQEIEH